jgi:hypothetical protein
MTSKRPEKAPPPCAADLESGKAFGSRREAVDAILHAASALVAQVEKADGMLEHYCVHKLANKLASIAMKLDVTPANRWAAPPSEAMRKGGKHGG